MKKLILISTVFFVAGCTTAPERAGSDEPYADGLFGSGAAIFQGRQYGSALSGTDSEATNVWTRETSWYRDITTAMEDAGPSADRARERLYHGVIGDAGAENDAEIIFHEIARYGENRLVSPSLERYGVLIAELLLLNAGEELYWNDRKPLPGNRFIFQNHDLIDLDRVAIPRRTTHEKALFPVYGGMIGHDYRREMTVVDEKPLRLSGDQMRAGRAPAGPEGRPIVICEVYPESGVYFEMGAHFANTLLSSIPIHGSRESLCDSLAGIEYYWKARHRDFVNRFGMPRRVKAGLVVETPVVDLEAAESAEEAGRRSRRGARR